MNDDNSEPRPWQEEATALEAWKYFASVGGADKDRMVTIAIWLLGLSAAILGFTFTQAVDGTNLKQPFAAGVLAALGMLVSVVAVTIPLVYGGYANWNWATADKIAEAYQWRYQRSTYSPFGSAAAPLPWLSCRAVDAALRLARPRDPKDQLAPVFMVFFWVAAISFAVHLVVLIWSVAV